MLRARTERMEVICEGAEYWAARFETEEQCEWLAFFTGIFFLFWGDFQACVPCEGGQAPAVRTRTSKARYYNETVDGIVKLQYGYGGRYVSCTANAARRLQCSTADTTGPGMLCILAVSCCVVVPITQCSAVHPTPTSVRLRLRLEPTPPAPDAPGKKRMWWRTGRCRRNPSDLLRLCSNVSPPSTTAPHKQASNHETWRGREQSSFVAVGSLPSSANQSDGR